jgi:hypothetical protein
MYTALREKAIVTTEGVLGDNLGWPADFFATFAGCLPDFPARESAEVWEA